MLTQNERIDLTLHLKDILETIRINKADVYDKFNINQLEEVTELINHIDEAEMYLSFKIKELEQA